MLGKPALADFVLLPNILTGLFSDQHEPESLRPVSSARPCVLLLRIALSGTCIPMPEHLSCEYPTKVINFGQSPLIESYTGVFSRRQRGKKKVATPFRVSALH
jgi:hypothetical protein